MILLKCILGKKNTYLNPRSIASFFLALLALTGCSSMDRSVSSPNLQHGYSKSSTPQNTNKKILPVMKEGINIYIDPQTGEFIQEPRQGQEALKITPEMQNATSTSSEGLVEEISPVPGGGVMIDLKGRFQSPLIITQDPSGKQKTRHLNDLPLYAPQHPTNKDIEGSSHERK
jgi:hypothetical protein